jgi:hypothetical protein
MSACIDFVKPLSNCFGLTEYQQINLIERIDTPDLPPNGIRSVRFERPGSTSPNRPARVDPRQKENEHQVLAVGTHSHVGQNIMDGCLTVQ